MSKILGSWSGMRNYLEKEMLTESLIGRVRYSCTEYPGMDGLRIFEIFIDKKPVKRFSFETLNVYFTKNGFKSNKDNELWSEFWTLKDKYSVNERTEYTDEEFCRALELYRSQDIKTSISSDNPLVRMFAVLDRRIGKRTICKLKEDIKNQPQWLQEFYNLRIYAELA